jgi:hypothetical protein
MSKVGIGGVRSVVKEVPQFKYYFSPINSYF